MKRMPSAIILDMKYLRWQAIRKRSCASGRIRSERMRCDAVVIAAGVNGLAAAVHLAAKGWKVAVVERADEPGGAVKTRAVTLPGFQHDLFAMNLGLFAGSPFFAA